MRDAAIPPIAVPLLVLLLLVLALPAAAQFAAPRAEAVVEGPEVRLSHLFAGIPPARDAVLGPAPPPGQRLVIEAPQLATIARQAGLLWRPAGHERVVLERPGRSLERAEVEAALRAALASLGLEPEAEIDLAPVGLPAVPAGAPYGWWWSSRPMILPPAVSLPPCCCWPRACRQSVCAWPGGRR